MELSPNELTVILPPHLQEGLDRVSMESKRIKQEIVLELIARYLEELEDARDAERILAQGGPTTSLASLRQELGL